MKNKFIFNPFIKIAGIQALSFGFLFIMIGALLGGFFNARFDGVLDLHFSSDAIQISPLLDQILIWLILVIIFYPLSLMLGTKPRFVDIAGTFALARFPYAIAPISNAGGWELKLAERLMEIDKQHPSWPLNAMESIIFAVLTIFSLVLIVWMVILYFNAWKTCTNLKGKKLIISFIVGLLVAEIASSYITRTFIA